MGYRGSMTTARRPDDRAAMRQEVAVMDVSFLLAEPWRYPPASLLLAYGLVMLWRGLWGGPGGARGLIRRRAGGLGRIEGWRLSVLGLAVAGLGAAWLWESALLLFLALGIGYVEVQEATLVINAWRLGEGRARESGAKRIDRAPSTTAPTMGQS